MILSLRKNVLNLKSINSGTYNSEGGSKVGRGLTTKVRVKMEIQFY